MANVRLVVALLVLAAFVYSASYFKADFERDPQGFVHHVSLDNAEHQGPYLTTSDRISGSRSLYYAVKSLDERPTWSSLRSPIFRMTIEDLRRFRYAKFCIKAVGEGRVKVALWVRPDSVIKLGFPFHAMPGLLPQLPDLFYVEPGGWRCYAIDLQALLSTLETLEYVNEFYLEWYVETSSSIGVYLDDFEIVDELPTASVDASALRNLRFKIFTSAEEAAESGVVRVAVYVYNGGYDVVAGFSVEANGTEVVERECSYCGAVMNNTYGKYVLYIRAPARFSLTTRLIIGERMYVVKLGEYAVAKGVGPLLSVFKEVEKIGEYTAVVKVRVVNVGNSSAFYVRIDDLIPRGLYLTNGSTKAWVKEIRPGEAYTLAYVVRAFYDGIFTLPEVRVIYYDDRLNELWAWSNKAVVQLKGSSTDGASIRLFPERPRPCAQLYVLNASELYGHELLAVSIQGVVNKYMPCIYVVFHPVDRLWLRELSIQYGVKYREITLSEALALASQFAKGYVVYDPSLPETINAATVLAGVYDLLIVGPGEERLVENLPLAMDLRGKWKSREEMYEWMIKHLLPLTNNKLLAVLHVYVPPPGWYTLDYKVRDYLIATSTFVFTISPRRDGVPYTPYDWVLLEEIYDRYYPPTIILGWWYDEGPNLQRLSHRGFAITASDQVPNLSLLSAFPPLHPLLQKLAVEKPRLNASGVYVTVVRSDGDSIVVDYHLMVGRGEYSWLAKREVPIGWTIQSLLAELAPVVLQYYYQSATAEDYFVAGPSGAGYYYPVFVRPGLRYVKYSVDQYYAWVADLDIYNTLHGIPLGDPRPIVTSDYAQFSGARYIFHGYEATAGPNSFFKVGNVLNMFTTADVKGQGLSATIERIEEYVKNASRPVFILIHAINWHTTYDDLRALVYELRRRGYTVVRPDEFFALADAACERAVECPSYGGRSFKAFSEGVVALNMSERLFTVRERAYRLVAQILGLAEEVGLQGETWNYTAAALANNDATLLNRVLRALLLIKSLREFGAEKSAEEVARAYARGDLDLAVAIGEEAVLEAARVKPALPTTATPTVTIPRPEVKTVISTTTVTSTVTVTTFVTTREVYTTTLTTTTTTTTTVTVTQSTYEYSWATVALIVVAMSLLFLAMRIARRATAGQPNI